MNKPTLKLCFVDFWDDFTQCHETKFLNYFKQNFDIVIDAETPDVVVYSCFGTQHQKYENALRIFFTGENIKPDFSNCDYSFGTVMIDYRGKHLWVPLSEFMMKRPAVLDSPITPELARRKFCSFIYSQELIGEGTRLRKRFCEQLMQQYKHVDCPGRVLHNLDAPELAARNDAANWLESKRRFLGQYKFNIAFENSAAPGYITEKLTDAYLGNTVPIYWGSDGDTAHYPKESMICANDYPTMDALIARIKEVDENDELYLQILAANPLRQENNTPAPDFDALIADFLKHAVEENIREHREPRATNFASLCQEYAEFQRHPYVRAGMKVYQGVQKIKRWLGLKKG